MKILSTPQIKKLDQATIEKQKITSVELMERAAKAFAKWFNNQFSTTDEVVIFAGMGNNGGDGLAVARLLDDKGYSVKVFIVRHKDTATPDFDINYKRLHKRRINMVELKEQDSSPIIPNDAIIIDALLGAGLTRPLTGFLKDITQSINETNHIKVAIDIPTGVFADKTTDAISIWADYTFSFELPKLAFMMPENFKRVGEWAIGTIHADQDFILHSDTPYYYIDEKIVRNIYKKKKKFDHKGTNGHALLLMGSYGMIGAARMSGEACLRSGTGLVTIHTPKAGFEILQTALPEVIVSVDDDDKVFTHIEITKKYTAVAVGCGLGKDKKTADGLIKIILRNKPLVIDADALNIISERQWHSHIPKNSILTPHLREFERLFGKSTNDFERLETLKAQAQKLECFIVLKGAHTAIATPDGRCYFNSTGNPGMATAGSGDVLTGIIVGLLAQGYTSEDAAILGVYIHGLAGDFAAKDMGYESILARDIISHLSKVFLYLNVR